MIVCCDQNHSTHRLIVKLYFVIVSPEALIRCYVCVNDFMMITDDTFKCIYSPVCNTSASVNWRVGHPTIMNTECAKCI